MGRSRKRYKKDFQLQASKLVVENGYSLADVSDRLGVPPSTINGWVKKHSESGEVCSRDSEMSPAAELRELRKKLARAELENEILKKAAAYFARDSL